MDDRSRHFTLSFQRSFLVMPVRDTGIQKKNRSQCLGTGMT
ncbi:MULTISPECIES: hypothetical protein [unclassified Wolbachia]|nr:MULTISPECIES: hypothetical protein [unclassified Wolbachia]